MATKLVMVVGGGLALSCGAPVGIASEGGPDTSPADEVSLSAGDSSDQVSLEPSARAHLALDVVFTDTRHRVLAVDPAGTAYALEPTQGSSRLYASSDGARTWSLRAQHHASFFIMTALSDGTLLADTIKSGRHILARSADHGATWTGVLPLGMYRLLTPHSVTELDGTTYLLEYQAFTQASVPLLLWASVDHGATWSVRHTFTGHRHGHGLVADPARHELWAYFGDGIPRCGIFRSRDAGRSWTLMVPGAPGCAVDAALRPGGGLIFGEDILYLPNAPHISSVTSDGLLTRHVRITGPSMSAHALAGGGFLVGTTRPPWGDAIPRSEEYAHIHGSWNGVDWEDLLRFRRLSTGEDAEADVYWQLPSGEIILQLLKVQGLGPAGVGYQLLRTRHVP